MVEIYYNETTTIDWYKSFSVNAINLNNHLVENTTEFKKEENKLRSVTIYIDMEYLNNKSTDFLDEEVISKEIESALVHKKNVTYVLYSTMSLYLVGFVVEN